MAISSIIRYCVWWGLSAANTVKKMLGVYGDKCINKATICRLRKEFVGGQHSEKLILRIMLKDLSPYTPHISFVVWAADKPHSTPGPQACQQMSICQWQIVTNYAILLSQTEGLPTVTYCLVLLTDTALWLVELQTLCAKLLTEISRAVTDNFCRSGTVVDDVPLFTFHFVILVSIHYLMTQVTCRWNRNILTSSGPDIFPINRWSLKSVFKNRFFSDFSKFNFRSVHDQKINFWTIFQKSFETDIYFKTFLKYG